MTGEEALTFRDRLVKHCTDDGWTPTRLQKIASADVVVWKAELYQAATSGSTLFLGAELPGEMLKPQLWLGLDDAQSIGEEAYAVKGVLFLPVYPGEFDCANEGSRPKQPGIFRLLIGSENSAPTILRDDYREMGWANDGSWEDSYSWAAHTAAFRFMQMEYVGRERLPLPRHIRRGAELGRRPSLPDINVITLRRVHREARPGIEGQPRDWACSWIVGGHWRKQWYPSKADWAPKYIAPYLKGDPNKPLRKPKGTVYAVRR